VRPLIARTLFRATTRVNCPRARQRAGALKGFAGLRALGALGLLAARPVRFFLALATGGAGSALGLVCAAAGSAAAGGVVSALGALAAGTEAGVGEA
jgi:hypothetical protein